jgi:hypothetical protein
MIVSTGRMSLKYSARTSITLFQSSMFVRITRVLTTSSILDPAFSSASLIISKQRLACAAGSPTPTVFPCESTGAVPPTDMYGPTLTAQQNPTTDSIGLPFETRTLFMKKFPDYSVVFLDSTVRFEYGTASRNCKVPLNIRAKFQC